MRELYGATSNFLTGRPALAPQAKAASVREQLFEKLPEKMRERVAPVMSELSDSYFVSTDMPDLIRHGRFFDAAIAAGTLDDVAVGTRRNLQTDHTELRVVTQDRRGLFADLSLAISSCGASIIGARLYTGHTGRVMNIFYLQNDQGLAYGRKNDVAIETLKARAVKAVHGKLDEISIPSKIGSRRAEAIPVHPDVTISSAPQGDRYIIDVQGRDRPGLLWELATALRDLGLDLLSAHIENVGTMAVDAFYVRGEDESDLTAMKRQTEIKQTIMSILNSESTTS